MTDSSARQARRVLQALADLAPSEDQRRVANVIPLEWFRWLPARGATCLRPMAVTDETVSVPIDRDVGERLAAIDQVRLGANVLRVGFLFVAGRRPGTGPGRRVFHPLISVPVRVIRPPLGGARLRPAGEAVLSDLIDGDARAELEERIEFGDGALDTIDDVAVSAELLAQMPQLQQFALDAAAAAGFEIEGPLLPAALDPDEAMRGDGLRVLVGAGVFIADQTDVPSRASALRAWTDEALETRTALHALYFPQERSQDDGDPYVVAAQALTSRQHEIVVACRGDDVTVVSGAPGTGKSHTIAAIAFDAVARGDSVLVAAKSEATVDALVDLLERTPGPDPIVFGSNARREALAARLASGSLRPSTADELDSARRALQQATTEAHALYDSLHRDLMVEQHRNAPANDVVTARALHPRLFAVDTNLDEIDHLVDTAGRQHRGWRGRRRARQARERLDALLGRGGDPAGVELDLAGVRRAAALARAARDVSTEGVRPSLDDDPRWDALEAAYGRVRHGAGVWLELAARSEDRLPKGALASVFALGTALRTGRAVRRNRLATLADAGLTDALPLWIGTLADIDDLMPPRPALFDLVILDEASSIDQGLAAPALLRGRRVVVVGDPRQLRHVSFLSDEQITRVLTDHELVGDPLLSARLDARRNSIFDVAVGAVPARILDEHWRCDPHLIDFVARRLYASEFSVATRTPASQAVDCVEVVRVVGSRDDDGVVAAEVEAIVAALRRASGNGTSSIGVVTPFRAQADALEAAVLAAFSADELIAMDLRVGTVHAFQGNERDVVYCSLGIGPEATAASWRFAGDSHLLSVFLTRARRRLVFVHSADPPPGGLIAQYLADADSPPGAAAAGHPLAPWAAAVIADLVAAHVMVSRSFPAGSHVVDAAVMVAEQPIAILFGMHPDGPAHHIDRRLSLQRSGWSVIDIAESRWRDHSGELVLELLDRLR